MKLPKRGTTAASHLDAIRATAALAVLGEHLRNLFLMDAGQAGVTSLPLKVLYFATRLGHQAVVVFFVLSGFFISGSVFQGLKKGRWSLGRYATARLTRLYVVLVPALVVGLALDRLGLGLFPLSPVYREGYAHMIPSGVADNLGPLDLLRNLAFLETFAGPVLGSNSPLWSLAYEFWFYVAFPLIALSFLPSKPARRTVLIVASLAVLGFMGLRTLSFAIWLLGTAVALAPETRLSRSRTFATLAWTLVLVSNAVAFAMRNPYVADSFMAVSFALALWSTTSRAKGPAHGAYARIAEFFAGFSFSLYVVHVPFLALLAAFLVRNGERWRPTPTAIAAIFGLVLLTLAYSVGFWALTERHTDRVRAWVEAWLARRSARRAPESARTAE